jgi:hypothetical protein
MPRHAFVEVTEGNILKDVDQCWHEDINGIINVGLWEIDSKFSKSNIAVYPRGRLRVSSS